MPNALHHNADKPLICYKTLSSPKWKSNYKDRTYIERINNAVLNTYVLHKMHYAIEQKTDSSLSLQKSIYTLQDLKIEIFEKQVIFTIFSTPCFLFIVL